MNSNRRSLAWLLALLWAVIGVGTAFWLHNDSTSIKPPGSIAAAVNAAGTVTLNGRVPTEAAKAAAETAAAKLPGVATVVNNLTVTDTVSDGKWLTDYESSLGKIGSEIKPFGYSWDGTKVVLTGVAPTEEAKQAAADAVMADLSLTADQVDNQITVKAAAVTPPAAADASIDANITADGITLDGVVPSQADKDAAGKAAADLIGDPAKVTNNLTVDAGAKADWVSAFGTALAGVGTGIRPLEIKAEGGQVTVTGEAPTAAAKAAAFAAVKSAVEPGLTAVDAITIKTAASPPAPLPVIQTTINKVLAQQTVQFETASAVLTPVGVAALNKVLPVIKSSKAAIEIDGHTDSQGDAAKNLALSQARAQTVQRYLVAHGVAATRLTAKGFGETKPIASNATDAGRQKNRRIDLRVKKG